MKEYENKSEILMDNLKEKEELKLKKKLLKCQLKK